LQQLSTRRGDAVVLALLRAALGLRPQPAVLLHPRKEWIERAGTEHVAVLGQLLEHPQAVDRSLGRVVQHVELAESETELSVLRRRHYGHRLRHPIYGCNPCPRLLCRCRLAGTFSAA